MKKFANNNPTNLDTYNEFKRRQQELFNEVKNDSRESRIESNLQTWLDSLEWPWNQADLSFFSGRPVELINESIAESGLSSLVIVGEEGKGKTFLSYAVIKEYLKAGLLSPSEIKMTTASKGAENINGMFKSREWKENFFDPSAKLLVVESLSMDPSRDELKQMNRFWREFYYHVRENKINFIVIHSEGLELPKDKKLQNKGLPVFTSDNNFNLALMKLGKAIKVDDSTRNKKRKLIK